MNHIFLEEHSPVTVHSDPNVLKLLQIFKVLK
jgi:hypothetical protein